MSATLLDGTPIFQTAEDRDNEKHAADRVAAIWHKRGRPTLTISSFGPVAPVDWYFSEHGRPIAVADYKRRSHSSTAFSTVFLNVRKHLALQLLSLCMGVPAFFFAEFDDGIRWILVRDVSGSTRVGGCAAFVKSQTDREPVYEIPINAMTVLQ